MIIVIRILCVAFTHNNSEVSTKSKRELEIQSSPVAAVSSDMIGGGYLRVS